VTRYFVQRTAGATQTDAPIVPMYYVNDILFSSERVGCVTYSPVFTIDFAALCRRRWGRAVGARPAP
jgi:hypothetical protein